METAQLNVWLTFWAGIGPILTAGIGAWWVRRNQVDDRNFHAAQEKSRLDSLHDEAETARVRQEISSRFTSRRQVFIDFLSASFDFVWKGEGPQEPEVRERHRERFSKCFTILMLLDQNAIGTEAMGVWNACHECVAMRLSPNEQTFQQLKNAREVFTEKAFALLSEQVSAVDAVSGIPALPIVQA
jgi:hypothetical protein